MLGHNWEPAEGTCIDYRWKGEHEVWLMEVRPQNDPAFRVEVGHPGMGSDFKGPYAGQACRMEVDVKKQKAKFDTTDPTLSHKAHRAAEQARYAAELTAAPGSAPAGQNLVLGGLLGGLMAKMTEAGAGSASYQVVSGADAAPMLNAILSGDPQERLAAIRALKHAQHEQLQHPGGTPAPFTDPGTGVGAGMGTAAPFSGGSAAPFSEPAAPFSGGSAAPFSGSAAPFSGSNAPFGEAEAPSADPTERLARLQALHDQGLVSLAEYTAQRQRIIESL